MEEITINRLTHCADLVWDRLTCRLGVAGRLDWSIKKGARPTGKFILEKRDRSLPHSMDQKFQCDRQKF